MFQKIKFELSPVEDGVLPHSDGYLVYSALLNEIESIDEKTSSKIHDEIDVAFNVSSLDGPFGADDEIEWGSWVWASETYDFTVSTFNNQEMMNTIKTLALMPDTIMQIADVEFELVTVEIIEEESVEELIKDVECDNIRISFDNTTSILRGQAIETTPNRDTVFNSILGKWNYIMDTDEYKSFKFDMDMNDIAEQIYREMDSLKWDTRTSRVGKTDDNKPIETKGFVGEATYKPTPNSNIWEQIVVLARAGEYLGVGAHTARGCGDITVKEN